MEKEKFEGTIILAIIDKSGSMDNIKNDAIGGFNAFLEEQQKLDGKCIISTVLFDDQYELINHGLQLNEAVKLTTKTYVPGGWTALYDAIGKGVNDVEKMKIEAERYLCVILTDGEENKSREYTKPMINELITRKREENWEFIFLAANQDAMAEGQSMGMSSSNSALFVADSDGIGQAYTKMSKGATTYRSMSMSDLKMKKDNLLEDEDK